VKGFSPLVHDNVTFILNSYYNGKIKGVCDDNFDENAAKTACKELYGNENVVVFNIS